MIKPLNIPSKLLTEDAQTTPLYRNLKKVAAEQCFLNIVNKLVF